MNQKSLFTLLIIIFNLVHATEQPIQINNDLVAYALPKQDLPQKFNENISLDRTFVSLDEFLMRLQSLTSLRTKITNVPSLKHAVPVKIFQQTGTITDLLNQVAIKFNATWDYDSDRNYVLVSYNQPVVVTPTANKTVWIISKSDNDLRTALTNWCRIAGWQLDWQVQGRFPIDFDWQVTGDFKYAINQVLKASQQSEIPLLATIFERNTVLRIISANK